MVWWGFRALKTPERAFSLPTLSASAGFWRSFQAEASNRKADGRHLGGISIADRKHSVNKGTAHGAPTGQTLDKDWTFTGQRLDIRPAY
jgi:hypothetical protein